MDADQNRLIGFPFALDERNVLQTVVDLAEGDEFEMTVLSGQVNLIAYFYDFLGAQAVSNQVLDGDDGHIEFLSDLHQLGQTSHRAVRVDDFDECGSRVEACDTHQVDRSLGVTCTLEHALVNGPQGIDVTRAAEV